MSLDPSDIINAMQRYKKGERPFRFTRSKKWYVFDLENENIYPLKYIYALATKLEPVSFNTSTSIAELKKLGFKLYELRSNKKSDLEEKIEASFKDTAEVRKRRLDEANKIPTQREVKVLIFNRNPDVVVEVLLRAKGKCEVCEKKAPFIRLKDGTPYLEVHHKIRLVDGGEDTVENAIAICPNCHRKEHYG